MTRETSFETSAKRAMSLIVDRLRPFSDGSDGVAKAPESSDQQFTT
jgi:hypothetical protein